MARLTAGTSHPPGAPAVAAVPRRRDTPAAIRVLMVELGEGVPDVPDAGAPGAARYGAAQVLVRLHGQPLGLLEIELPPGGLPAPRHAERITQRLGAMIDAHLKADGLGPLESSTMAGAAIGEFCPRGDFGPRPAPSVSVVVPTCARPSLLTRTLDSLAQVAYPCFEVVVVDNAPHAGCTAELVRQRAVADPRVRYASEPRSGVAYARNRGLAEAEGEIVAFADDDVVVDHRWLRALVGGFLDEDVAAVTGFVLASELESPAQVWIERYGGFGKGCRRTRFERGGFETIGEDAADPAAAIAESLYPYLPGRYGSGANMAFRTTVARALGGFDPLLGAGGPIRAGEDIDLLMRVVLSDHALVYEPAAIVWHRHRRDVRDLRRVVYRYGVGLGAVMGKCLATDRAGRRDLLRRLPRGVAYALTPGSAKNSGKRAGYPLSLTALELCGIALGPAYYAAAAWSARTQSRRRSALMTPPGGSSRCFPREPRS